MLESPAVTEICHRGKFTMRVLIMLLSMYDEKRSQPRQLPVAAPKGTSDARRHLVISVQNQLNVCTETPTDMSRWSTSIFFFFVKRRSRGKFSVTARVLPLFFSASEFNSGDKISKQIRRKYSENQQD